MKGRQIFEHALRQVMNNLPAALRVSGALYLVQAVIGLLLGAQMMGAGMGGEMAMRGAAGGLLGGLISLAAGVWIAVAWHRYVLLSEEPTAVLPPFMGAYFLKALLIGIALLVMAMILGMIAGVIVTPLFSMGAGVIGLLVLSLVVQVPLIFLGLRMAAALPGAAIGVDHGFLAGWEATKDDWVSILQLAVIMALAMWVVNLLGFFVFGRIPVLAQLWQLVIGWPVMMVGLSILTTLYGHYVQKRPLA